MTPASNSRKPRKITQNRRDRGSVDRTPSKIEMPVIEDGDSEITIKIKRLQIYLQKCLHNPNTGENLSMSRLAEKIKRSDGRPMQKQSLVKYVHGVITNVDRIDDATIDAIAKYPAWFNNYKPLTKEQLKRYLDTGEYEAKSTTETAIDKNSVLEFIDKITDAAKLAEIIQRASTRMASLHKNGNKPAFPRFNSRILEMLEQRKIVVEILIREQINLMGEPPSNYKNFEEYCSYKGMTANHFDLIRSGGNIDQTLMGLLAAVLNESVELLTNLKNELSD